MEYLLLGYIVGSFSLDGTIKILSKTDFADIRYQEGNTIFLYSPKTKERLPMTVVSYRSNGQFDFVKVSEINSPEEAENLPISIIGLALGSWRPVKRKNPEHQDEQQFNIIQ